MRKRSIGVKNRFKFKFGYNIGVDVDKRMKLSVRRKLEITSTNIDKQRKSGMQKIKYFQLCGKYSWFDADIINSRYKATREIQNTYYLFRITVE